MSGAFGYFVFIDLPSDAVAYTSHNCSIFVKADI